MGSEAIIISLNFTARVPVFDANVRVGNRNDELSPFLDQSELLAELDRHGVQRALIYHAHADNISPISGNNYLEDWLGDDGRLHPIWSALPTSDCLKQIQALHKANRVRCVRLVDTSSVGLPFRPWAYDSLLSWLCETSVPLWVSLPEANLDDLVTTLQAYPKLVTVLTGAHYTHALWVRPLLQALPSSYLELSRYEPIGEVEALRDEFGAERLLYGSWYPNYAMGPMLFYLHHTNLNDGDLALVCSGNLERLLSMSTHD